MERSDKLRACVLLGLPSGYGTPNLASAISAFNNQADADVKVFIKPETGSSLSHNFNKCWLQALGCVNNPITHFAMLHDDVSVSPLWISTLLDVMDETKADLVSAVIPIKNLHGLTSTGYGDPNDWYDYRRLTMKEACELPETFTIDDLPEQKQAGKCLLINTGCWIADMRRAQWNIKDPLTGQLAFHFWQDHRITIWPDGIYCPEFCPEDWNWSRLCHKYGLKVVATRKVKVLHHGNQAYPNDHAWGDATDDEMTGFMAAKKKAYAQPVAKILSELNAKKEKCLV